MSGIDELSRALGRLEAGQKAILLEQKSQGEEIKTIREKVQKEKVRSAYVAGGVAVVLVGIKEVVYKAAGWAGSGG